MDLLEGEKQEKLRQFQEITNTEDVEIAICTLASLDWNLERALETHLMGDDDGSQNARPVENIGARPVARRQPLSDISVRHDIDDMDIVEQDDEVVILPSRNGSRPGSRPGSGASSSNGHRHQPEPSSSSSTRRSRRQQVQQPTYTVDSDDDVIFDDDYSAAHDDVPVTKQRMNATVPLIPSESDSIGESLNNFVAVFEARFASTAGTVMPNFSVDTLNNTIREAFEAPGRDISERRPLAIYIHNDRSVAANIFPSNIMCRDEVANLLRHQFVLWGWDVSFKDNEIKLAEWLATIGLSDTRQFIDMMRYDAERFPLLVLLIREKGTLRVVDMCYGMDSADQVMTKLLTCVEEYQSIRLTEANEKREREERERIRQEQHMEYEMSLQADLARKEAKEREIREQKEEEERKRKAEEDEKMRRAQLESELPSEPAENAPDAIVVRFRAPEGKQFTRRFRFTEQLSVLFKYLSSQGFSTDEYRFFNADFPKKDVSTWSVDSSFESLKWPRREQIHVEEKY